MSNEDKSATGLIKSLMKTMRYIKILPSGNQCGFSGLRVASKNISSVGMPGLMLGKSPNMAQS